MDFEQYAREISMALKWAAWVDWFVAQTARVLESRIFEQPWCIITCGGGDDLAINKFSATCYALCSSNLRICPLRAHLLEGERQPSSSYDLACITSAAGQKAEKEFRRCIIDLMETEQIKHVVYSNGAKVGIVSAEDGFNAEYSASLGSSSALALLKMLNEQQYEFLEIGYFPVNLLAKDLLYKAGLISGTKRDAVSRGRLLDFEKWQNSNRDQWIKWKSLSDEERAQLKSQAPERKGDPGWTLRAIRHMNRTESE